MNTEQSSKIVVNPKKVLRKLWVQIEPPTRLLQWVHPDRHEAVLKSWAREFEEFIRDHRSQDPVSLNVIRDEYEGCSRCDAEWETYVDEDGDTCCASCGHVHKYTEEAQP